MAGIRQFRNDLDATLVDKLLGIFEHRGVSQKEGLTRMIAWFVQQTPTIQQHILRQLPEDLEADIARMLLERMAEAPRAKGFIMAGDPPTTRPQQKGPGQKANAGK